MSYAVALNDVLRMRLGCRFRGPSVQYAVNVLNYKVIAVSGTSVNLGMVADALHTALTGLMPNVLTSLADYLGVGFTKILPLPISLEEVAGEDPIPGEAGDTPLPPQVSPYVTKYTALGGRANRGRLYLPFADAAMVGATGILVTGAMTAITSVCEVLFDDRIIPGTGGDSATISPTILHRATGLTTFMTSFGVHPRLATQRRRSAVNQADESPFAI